MMAESNDQESLRQSVETNDPTIIMPANSTSESEEEESATLKFFMAITIGISFIFPIIEPLDPDLFAWSSIFHALMDPLILYVPLINEDTKCLMLDNRLKIAAIILRSFGDLRYVLRICLRVKKGWGESHFLKKIAMSIAIDILYIIPLSQVAILNFLPKMRGSGSLKTMKLLNSLILLQYLLRLYPVYAFCKEANRIDCKGRIPNRLDYKRVLIIVNFLGYILASHILGAFWYFFSILREIDCWGHACRVENGCDFSISCDENIFRDITLLENLCPINPPDAKTFDFGVFLYALQSGMQESTNFSQKLLQCFSWGLRNLSSFASNLTTSTYGWENLFVVVISMSGLVLFIYLLGHMQATSRSLILRENMKTIIEPKIRSMLFEYGLPKEMESKVKRVAKEKLEENEDLIVENMFSILFMGVSGVEAKDIAEIKCSLFMDKLTKVNGLKYKGVEVLKNICEHLEPMIYREGSYIIREGEPLDMMFFITWGNVLTYATNNGGSNGSSGTIQLEKEKDGLYGEELLTWAEGPSSKLSNLPISPITVKCHKKVEIFALKATDLQSHFNMDMQYSHHSYGQ